jgi:hypothetical protein
MMEKEDLQKIRDDLLRQCPSCDMGLSHACVCPPAEFDFRPIVMRLVGEIEAFREEDERARKMLNDPAHFEGFSRRELAKIIRRHEEHRAYTEASLAEQYEALQAYEQVTKIGPERVKHFAECDACEVYVESGASAIAPGCRATLEEIEEKE